MGGDTTENKGAKRDARERAYNIVGRGRDRSATEAIYDRLRIN